MDVELVVSFFILGTLVQATCCLKAVKTVPSSTKYAHLK